ncbi:MAG TPA: hypothetical protein EYH32_03345 [Anaerolineae bacterium]|nr:hypothetical protein [Anaerolineae bacterium]
MKRTVSRKGMHILHILLICAILLGGLGTAAVPASHAESNCEPDGRQASGAVYRICMPAEGEWNGDLVVYAHGYVAFNEPIAIPEDQLSIPDGPSLPEMVNGLGFAFAATSYSVNGLAVQEGLADLVDLVEIFSETHGQPGHVYLAGPSEGGLITALGVEQHFNVFDGGLSTCGPVGDFRKQLNYWGDVRVLFDYFFPGVIPGSPVAIPQDVIDNWDTVYKGRVEDALRADPHATAQLLVVARVPVDPTNPDSAIDALVQLLWYNVFATNDGVTKLGGQPYDNSRRLYRGSDNDLRLNRSVPRFQADPAVIAEIEAHYQTSGDLSVPLVTLHTLGDPIVPYWHELLYNRKIATNGDVALHTNIPSLRYGHCNFTAAEVLLAFAVLVYRVTGDELPDVERVLPDAQARAEYRYLARAHGLLR